MTTGGRPAGGAAARKELAARLARIEAGYSKPRSPYQWMRRALARAQVRREYLLGRRAALWFGDDTP